MTRGIGPPARSERPPAATAAALGAAIHRRASVEEARLLPVDAHPGAGGEREQRHA